MPHSLSPQLWETVHCTLKTSFLQHPHISDALPGYPLLKQGSRCYCATGIDAGRKSLPAATTGACTVFQLDSAAINSMAHYSLCAKSGQPSDFANKSLLESSHTRLLIDCDYSFCNDNWIPATETSWPAKPKIFLLWPYMEKVCRSLVENIDLRNISNFSICAVEASTRNIFRLQKYYWLLEKKKSLEFFWNTWKSIYLMCVCTSYVTSVHACVFWGKKRKMVVMWKLMHTAMWTFPQNTGVFASKWWLTQQSSD